MCQSMGKNAGLFRVSHQDSTDHGPVRRRAKCETILVIGSIDSSFDVHIKFNVINFFAIFFL